MGTLIYSNSAYSVEFDDRTLFHLQLVIGPKLRRQESFYFTWGHANESGRKRTTLWIERSISLIFEYDDDSKHEISRDWLELLTVSASSTQGLQLISEPATVKLAS
jgi:hypothetical protein